MHFPWLVGLVCAASVSAAAVRLRSLTRGGATAATVVGTIVFSAGGLPWTLVLLTFFLSGSLLSLPSADGKRQVGEKGSKRDASQVLANGGAATLAALGQVAHPASRWAVVFSAAVAAASADTWATELGRRFGDVPFHLRTMDRVPVGTSGGVTVAGTAALAAGALIITVTAQVTLGVRVTELGLIWGAGCAGAVLDSVLGAFVQERRCCPQCGVNTEQRVHHDCGNPTVHVGGLANLDNDVVNTLMTLAAAAIAVLFEFVH